MVHTSLAITKLQERLLRLMQEIHFGRIEGLVVRGGEPVIESSTRVLKDVKLGQQVKRRPVLVDRDYWEKPQVIEMLRQFNRLGDGVVQCLEVHDGLPFRMRTVETVRT